MPVLLSALLRQFLRIGDVGNAIFIFATVQQPIDAMKTQYVTDAAGKKTAVIVPVKEYRQLLEHADELECIRAYDRAKSRKTRFVPAEDVFAAIERERGFSQS